MKIIKIIETCGKEPKNYIAVDDLIKKLKKRGITKYHILGELLNITNRGR